MKKTVVFLFSLGLIFNFQFSIFNLAQAQQHNTVGPEQTRRVAANFWNTYRSADNKPVAAADLVQLSFDGLQHMDIYSADGQGYVIVSAVGSTRPVLAYSFENTMPAELPINMRQWLDYYEIQLVEADENNLQPSARAAAEWSQLLDNPVPPQPIALVAVSPLCTTTWDQPSPYNRLCPYDSIDNTRAVVGCTATAMAQIMKRWNYPAFGVGSHSYQHHLWRDGISRSYGTLCADFGQTTYHWSHMTDYLDITSRQREINAIATLSLHCGISVEMEYGTSELGGSGAWTISYGNPDRACSEHAMRDYFKYDSSILGLERRNYPDSSWRAFIDADLALGRPILYTGNDVGAGHAFVLDGADTSNRYHFNWGWSGSGNGYFVIDSLNLYFSGTGATPSHTYNMDQTALFHIFPREEETFVHIERTDTICNNLSSYDIYDYSLPVQNAVHQLEHLDTQLTLIVVVQQSRVARFLSNNGGEEQRQNIDYCPAQGLTMPECTYTNPGYVFRGWCIQRDGSDSIYRPGQVLHINRSALFYAIWIDSAIAAGIGDLPLSTLDTPISLYPNPTTGRVTLDIAVTDGVSAVVFDALGRIVARQAAVVGTKPEIDLSSLPSGIYTIQLRTPTTVHNSRVIKQ